MKKKFCKLLLLPTMLSILITSFGTQSFAGDILNGYSGVDVYTSWTDPDCSAGDWFGASVTQEIRNYLSPATNRVTNAVTNFEYYDQSADERDILYLANDVNFFVYSGHGEDRTTENAAHYYAQSNGTPYHSSSQETIDSIRARQTEIRFGSYSSGKLRWITMYCCNWLTNSGSSTKQTNIFKTMNGARLTMGFASMYYKQNMPDYDEQMYYASWLSDYNRYAIADCFISAAMYFQPRVPDISSPVIARVIGDTSAAYDLYENSSMYSLASNYPSVPSYSTNPNNYAVLYSYAVE